MFSKYGKIIYVVMVCLIAMTLALGFLPSLKIATSFMTPPVALFLGLLFALLCGQPCPKFNKKASKKLLQYAVVGLGFGMNLYQSIASGKEGMMFTIVSVAGTMLIGMLIGYKLLKVNKTTSYLINIVPATETMVNIIPSFPEAMD